MPYLIIEYQKGKIKSINFFEDIVNFFRFYGIFCSFFYEY